MNIIDILLRKLPLSKAELSLLIVTAPNRYKVHTIDKRNHRGKRTIAQPTAEVKIVQTVIQNYLLNLLPIHECATAYRRGISIRDHAAPHAGKKYLLKIDFTDFFPSIKGSDFVAHLDRYLKVENETANLLESIFFWRQRKTKNLVLAIGAPSSPWLSNTVMYDFDKRLTEYCHINNIIYTRYADDLALSTDFPNILGKALKYIQQLCGELDYPRLAINEKKTVFTSTKFNRTLTGLVLANDGSVSIGRTRKREIRALAKNYARGEVDAEKVGHLRGLLSFTWSVDQSFNASIKRMIGEEKYSLLMK